MYTEHENGGGGGGGKPEYMEIEFGMVMMPFIQFKGGCEGCQTETRQVLHALLTSSMEQVARTFITLMTKGRGECDVNVMNKEAVEDQMRSKLGNEITDKLMEMADGRI